VTLSLHLQGHIHIAWEFSRMEMTKAEWLRVAARIGQASRCLDSARIEIRGEDPMWDSLLQIGDQLNQLKRDAMERRRNAKDE